jgi:hypothetical protein
VPYEISLRDAINKGMLVPFHYYGIYDDTDYSGIHIVNGEYDTKELDRAYIGNMHRHDVIFKHYKKYHSVRALGFCCSRAHAEEMAREFSKRGVPSVAVYSNAEGEYSEDREVAIKKLKCGEIKVIFSVDMFNEGVDIASVDMVMFLRPTESPIVFLQQLGRGLRRSKGKEFLNVLDFIGNYEKAGRTRFLLKGNGRERVETNADNEYMGYPDDCLVDFDMRLIDLFQEMDRKHLKVRDLILQEYFRVKEFVKHRPDRMELFTYMDDNIYQLVLKNSKDNLFKHYLDFLNENNEIKDEEKELYNGIEREFLNIIETTNMTKVYKMPVLMAFYNGGDVRMEVTKEQLLCAWKEFFGQGTNWKDLDSGLTYEKYKVISDSEHLKKIMQMPVHFLLESGKGFFVEKDGFGLALCEDLRGVVGNDIFAAHMGDIIRYRTYDYYQRRYKDKE